MLGRASTTGSCARAAGGTLRQRGAGRRRSSCPSAPSSSAWTNGWPRHDGSPGPGVVQSPIRSSVFSQPPPCAPYRCGLWPWYDRHLKKVKTNRGKYRPHTLVLVDAHGYASLRAQLFFLCFLVAGTRNNLGCRFQDPPQLPLQIPLALRQLALCSAEVGEQQVGPFELPAHVDEHALDRRQVLALHVLVVLER